MNILNLINMNLKNIINLLKGIGAFIGGLFIVKKFYDKNSKIKSLKKEKEKLKNEVNETNIKLDNVENEILQKEENIETLKVEKEIEKVNNKVNNKLEEKLNSNIKLVEKEKDEKTYTINL